MAKEVTFPKNYLYSVEGVLDKEGNLKKFSVASLGKDLSDEFDLEGVAYTSCLNFYLEHPDYQDSDKWPLKFKFYASKTATPIELEMELSYAPCFLSKQKSIVKVISQEEKTEVVEKEVKKTRHKTPSELTNLINSFEDYLSMTTGSLKRGQSVQYGGILEDVSNLNLLLSAVKADSEDYVPIVKIKYKDVEYYIHITEDLYTILEPNDAFIPRITEEGELIEVNHYV